MAVRRILISTLLHIGEGTEEKVEQAHHHSKEENNEESIHSGLALFKSQKKPTHENRRRALVLRIDSTYSAVSI